VKKLVSVILRLFGFHVQRIPNNYVKEQIEAKFLLNSALKKYGWLTKYGIDQVIDIGANDGQFASESSQVFTSSSYHCFEPIPSVFTSLKNRFDNNSSFHFYNFALGSEDGTGTINLNEYSPSSSILEMEKLHKDSFEFTKNSSKQDIVIKRLDDFIDVIRPTTHTMVKIDVQGYEMQVLLGGASFIKLSKVVIIEMSFEQLYKDQPLFNEVYTELYNLGFSYHGNLEQLTSPATNEILQADCIFVNRNL
jgi:FkbM family methyltransferase